jgi:hypothetical protein
MAYLEFIPFSIIFTGINNIDQALQRSYLGIQFYVMVFFLIPLQAFYLIRNKLLMVKNKHQYEEKNFELQILDKKSTLFSLFLILFSSLFMFFIIKNNLLFIRLGAEATSSALIGLSFVEFAVIRLFQDFSVLLISIQVYILLLEKEKKKKTLIVLSLIVYVSIFLIFTVINSRLQVLLFGVSILGIYIHSVNSNFFTFKRISGFFAGIFVILILMSITLNYRRSFVSGDFSEIGNVVNPFDDDQGINRLNCVDLMAQLNIAMENRNPALGAAWQQVYWNVFRYFDPAGFDAFRATLTTTAKSYLMKNYLGWDLTDYYSCTLTDFFGNFYIFGFILAFIVYAFIFSNLYLFMSGNRNAAGIIVGFYLAVSVLNFDQEGISLLSVWTKHLPFIIFLFLINPFKVLKIYPKELNEI